MCRYANIKTEKSKMAKILNKGFKNDTLCYLGNLKNIIYNFFDIKNLPNPNDVQ